MIDRLGCRPRLALPYTVLTSRGAVRLVAGEDLRYTFTAPGIDDWLPRLLARLDGTQTIGELLGYLGTTDRGPALETVERLYGERIVTDGTAVEAHRDASYRWVIEGSGPLREALDRNERGHETRDLPPLGLLCQDRLDYEEALEFNRRCLRGGSPWLWATTGPMARGYVSPPFWPDAGPCLACLIGHFRRLSPAPEIYDDLIAHARRQGPVAAVPFPPTGIDVLAALVCWKADQLGRRDPPSAIYALHVLELETMETSAHRVFIDPDCGDCHGGR